MTDKKLINMLRSHLDLRPNDMIDVRRNHIGYWSETFILILKDKKYFLKRFKLSKKLNRSYNVEQIFHNEVDAIKKANTVSTKTVSMPKVHKIDYENKIIIFEFIESKTLSPYLNRFNILRKLKNEDRKLFYEIGIYMAKYHKEMNKGSFSLSKKDNIIFGDVNCNNILFSINKIYFIDPFPKRDSIYEDLAQFIINFYPFNFFRNIYLSRKNLEKLICDFLRGYSSYLKVQIDIEELNKYLISNLESQKEYIINSFFYNIKKKLINHYICFLIKSLKNGKISIGLR